MMGWIRAGLLRDARPMRGAIDNPSVPEAEALRTRPAGLLLDLAIYLSVMFLVRELWLPGLDFIANALFYSLTGLVVASWRMRVRGVSWRTLGLCRPRSLLETVLVAGGILAITVLAIVTFEILKDQLPFAIAPDISTETAATRFGDLRGNWPRFSVIIVFVCIESGLEELLDRGFLMNWLERLFSGTSAATALAVILQAAIFGFRHAPSHGLSGAITVSIIGLIMGVAYVAFGRNLWPLILAHSALNSASMIDRVL